MSKIDLIVLIELKKEFIKHAIDLCTFPFYQGIQHFYDYAKLYKKDNTENSEIRIFQDFLRKIIPNWNNETLEKETNRIRIVSKSGNNLDILINLIIRLNILILTNNSIPLKKCDIFNIKLENFIHKCYIEVAKLVFNNPFLFYHQLPPIELKKNQREVLLLIKEGIETTFRDLVPLNFVLTECMQFFKDGFNKEDFYIDKVVKEVDKKVNKEVDSMCLDKQIIRDSMCLDKQIIRDDIYNFILSDNDIKVTLLDKEEKETPSVNQIPSLPSVNKMPTISTMNQPKILAIENNKNNIETTQISTNTIKLLNDCKKKINIEPELVTQNHIDSIINNTDTKNDIYDDFSNS